MEANNFVMNPFEYWIHIPIIIRSGRIAPSILDSSSALAMSLLSNNTYLTVRIYFPAVFHSNRIQMSKCVSPNKTVAPMSAMPVFLYRRHSCRTL